MPTTDKIKQRAYQNKHYSNNKQYYVDKAAAKKRQLMDIMIEAKSHPCMDCGVSYDYYVMDFDHRPGEIKIMNPSLLKNNGSEKKLRVEIAKCDLVCSNCHRIRTHQRMTRDSEAGITLGS